MVVDNVWCLLFAHRGPRPCEHTPSIDHVPASPRHRPRTPLPRLVHRGLPGLVYSVLICYVRQCSHRSISQRRRPVVPNSCPTQRKYLFQSLFPPLRSGLFFCFFSLLNKRCLSLYARVFAANFLWIVSRWGLGGDEWRVCCSFAVLSPLPTAPIYAAALSLKYLADWGCFPPSPAYLTLLFSARSLFGLVTRRLSLIAGQFIALCLFTFFPAVSSSRLFVLAVSSRCFLVCSLFSGGFLFVSASSHVSRLLLSLLSFLVRVCVWLVKSFPSCACGSCSLT